VIDPEWVAQTPRIGISVLDDSRLAANFIPETENKVPLSGQWAANECRGTRSSLWLADSGKQTGLVDNLETQAKIEGPGYVNSESRRREHQRFHAGLLEMVVGGECFGQAPPLHDYHGKTISEAPLFVAAAPVQIDSSHDVSRIERNNFETLIGVSSAIALCGRGPRRCIRERVEPLPKNSLGRHDPASGPHHGRVPGNGLGVVLISFARKGNPE